MIPHCRVIDSWVLQGSCKKTKPAMKAQKRQMTELLHYLKTRRSALAMTLVEPAPDAMQIKTMIEIASRVPDHCKLAPWRFVEYMQETRKRLAGLFVEISNKHGDISRRDSREKQIASFASAPLVIGVVSSPVENPKVPTWEQELSCGAACMQLLVAANALGFEAQWLSGFYMLDDHTTPLLGIKDGERIAGMIHIGSSDADKKERTRPPFDAIFSKI